MKSKNKHATVAPHVVVQVSPYTTVVVRSVMTNDQKTMLKALSALLI